MSYEVDVVEIKTQKIAFRCTPAEMQFTECYSPYDKLRTDDGEFLTGPAAAEFNTQSRRAIHIRNNDGRDKYIIWSPEFEKFVGTELGWLDDMHDMQLEMNNCHKRLEEETDRKDYWMSLNLKKDCQLEEYRIKTHNSFLIAVATTIISVGSILALIIGT